MRKLLYLTLPSILVCWLLLEVSLRLGAAAYMHYRHPENLSAAASMSTGTYNILCVGDSFTEGSGATADTSYPAHLERLLQQKGYTQARVFNRGVVGTTTSLLAQELEANIGKYNPRVIIILSGVNNGWNFDKSSYFILKGRSASFWGSVHRWASCLRTYKLAKLLWMNLRARLAPPEKILCTHEIFARDIKSESLLSYEKALLDADGGDYASAEQHFKDAVRTDDNNYPAHLGLAHVYQCVGSRSLLAKKELDRAIQLIDHFEKWDCGPLTVDVVTRVRDMEGETGLRNLKTHLQQALPAAKAKQPVKTVHMALDFLKDRRLAEKVFTYDIGEVMRLAGKRNIRIVLQTYPQQRDINGIIRAAAKKYGLVLVDNEPLFKERLRGLKESDFFVPDGHCNGSGYKIMAENVYAALLSQRLLEPPAEKAK